MSVHSSLSCSVSREEVVDNVDNVDSGVDNKQNTHLYSTQMKRKERVNQERKQKCMSREKREFFFFDPLLLLTGLDIFFYQKLLFGNKVLT